MAFDITMPQKPTYEDLEELVKKYEKAEFERKQAEEKLHKSEERLRLALAGSGVHFWEWSAENDRFYFGDNWLKFIGYESEELLFDRQWWKGNVHPDSIPVIDKAWCDYHEGRKPRFEAEYLWKTRTDEWKWIECICEVVEWDKDKKPIRYLGTHKDITEIKQMEQGREELITELRAVLSNVQELSGMLKICSSCKKIRDDEGSWNEIDSFISERSKAIFSHSLCPDCIEQLYPDLDDIDDD